MKKRVNTTIAKCKCRFSGCQQIADVRRMKDHERGNLYLVCSDHGIDKATSGKGQEILNGWVEKNTIREGQKLEQDQEIVLEKPKPVQEPQKPQEPVKILEAQEQEQEPLAKKKGFFLVASSQFQEWFGD